MYRVADCSLRSSSIGYAGRCRAAFNARCVYLQLPFGGDVSDLLHVRSTSLLSLHLLLVLSLLFHDA